MTGGAVEAMTGDVVEVMTGGVVAAQAQALQSHAGGVTSLAVSSDGALVLTGSTDRTARIWDATTGTELLRFDGHTGDVNSVAMARQTAHVLATGGDEGIVKVWDVRNLNAPTCELQGHEGSILSIAWSPSNEDQLATSSADSHVFLWNVEDKDIVFEHNGHCGSVMEVAWCEDPKYESVMLVSVSEEDNMIHIWERYREDDDDEDNQEARIAEAGGVEAIVAALGYHREENDEDSE